MASYVYTAGSSTAQSANIATDKIRIATTSAIHFVTGSPQIDGTGNITCATTAAAVVGTATTFVAEIAAGYWIGNSTGTTVGIVSTVTNNGNLVLTANAAIDVTNEEFTYNPAGVPFAIATANSEIIPANTVERSIIVGQGNVVAYLTAGIATADVFSITELGMPHPTTGTE